MLCNENVLEFDVAVANSERVEVFDGGQKLVDRASDLGGFHWGLSEMLEEVAVFSKTHELENLGVGVANFVNVDDRGMIDKSGEHSFVEHQHFPVFGLLELLLGDYLYGEGVARSIVESDTDLGK